MKQSNLKVGVIGIIIFCVLVLIGAKWEHWKKSKEHFNGSNAHIVPWETEQYRYVYTFKMVHHSQMKEKYNNVLLGAYDRLNAFTKEYFNSFVSLVRSDRHRLVSLENRQVAILFSFARIDKATNKERRGELLMSVNLDRLNNPKDLSFHESFKEALKKYVLELS